MRWFRDAKFGLFIHRGLYAIPAGVWAGQQSPALASGLCSARIPRADYEQLARHFNPVAFNAAEWVALAKKAGQ